eukprot:1279675-Amphidinium_carterae.1
MDKLFVGIGASRAVQEFVQSGVLFRCVAFWDCGLFGQHRSFFARDYGLEGVLQIQGSQAVVEPQAASAVPPRCIQ